MQIGIGLPATIPGVRGDVVLDWARHADAGPFSSLGIIDRLVYSNYEPIVTLAAAAGATQRIRLMPTILIAPLRNTGVLAKQAASLDALSGGRLTLGLAVGGREDDFRFADVSFRDRGRRFEKQLDTMYRVWSGQPVDGLGPVGPAPVRAGGPQVLIGGFSEARRSHRVGSASRGTRFVQPRRCRTASKRITAVATATLSDSVAPGIGMAARRRCGSASARTAPCASPPTISTVGPRSSTS